MIHRLQYKPRTRKAAQSTQKTARFSTPIGVQTESDFCVKIAIRLKLEHLPIYNAQIINESLSVTANSTILQKL